jgi:hypothetical protein
MPRGRKFSYQTSVVSVVAAFAATGCEGDALRLDCSERPMPPDGTPCEGTDVCNYGCEGAGVSGTVACKDGRIENYLASCNPPAPPYSVWNRPDPDAGRSDSDAGRINCAWPPGAGSACSGTDVCTYYCPPFSTTDVVRCHNGRVEGSQSTCNPPAPRDSGLPDASDPVDASGIDSGS